MKSLKQIFSRIINGRKDPWDIGKNNNPIFIEYYSHIDAYCYKINIPWTKYKTHTVVLCPIEEGIKKARQLALRVLLDNLKEALDQPVIEKIMDGVINSY